MLVQVTSAQVQRWLLWHISRDTQNMEEDATPRPPSYDKQSLMGYGAARQTILQGNRYQDEPVDEHLERLLYMLHRSQQRYRKNNREDDAYSSGAGSLGPSIRLLTLLKNALDVIQLKLSAGPDVLSDPEAFGELDRFVASMDFSLGVEESRGPQHSAFFDAARQGHPEAQFQLARALHLGEEVEVNLPEARRWYLEALNNGVGEAAPYLWRMLEGGEGGGVDVKTGVQCLQAGARLNNPEGCYLLAQELLSGRHMPVDPEGARLWLLKSAEGGWDLAFLELAQLHLKGLPGLPPQPWVARQWLKALQQKGNPEASEELRRIDQSRPGRALLLDGEKGRLDDLHLLLARMGFQVHAPHPEEHWEEDLAGFAEGVPDRGVAVVYLRADRNLPGLLQGLHALLQHPNVLCCLMLEGSVQVTPPPPDHWTTGGLVLLQQHAGDGDLPARVLRHLRVEGQDLTSGLANLALEASSAGGTVSLHLSGRNGFSLAHPTKSRPVWQDPEDG